MINSNMYSRLMKPLVIDTCKLLNIRRQLLFNRSLWYFQPSVVSPLISKNAFIIQERTYAKSKKKDGKHQKIHTITDEELSQLISVHKYKEDLDYILEDLKEDFIQNLSIRTSLGALEAIRVDFDGDKYPLNELAQVIRKSPTSVMITAVDFPQASSDIKKAILNSGMNLNPQQDGTTIFLQVPKVTKERREALAQNAKVCLDKAKLKIREVQNKNMKKVKSKEGSVSDDLIRDAEIKIRDMAVRTTSDIEQLTKVKQAELLKLNN